MHEPTICSITYHVVERIAGWYDQTTNRTSHCIHLYADTISTAKNIFKLEHVLDISYKPFSGGAGLLYLHTNQGVFMFEVDADPLPFIQAYKNLRG
jgi:hypothetical protein